MNSDLLKILVVGATGSIGKHVVHEALEQGHSVRALVRDQRKGKALDERAELVLGDLTDVQSLLAAVDDMDAIVFTHGSTGGGRAGSEAVDYGGVRNVLTAVGPRKVRIALMTSIGVTNRTGSYNQSTEVHDWKRRSERLVRASGLPYTIVRPGWFDYNDSNQHRLVLLQGDTRQSGTPRDGVVSRKQIAETLVQSLTCDEAVRKTFELVAEAGAAPGDFHLLFEPVVADAPNSLDAIRDAANMPLTDEPARVLEDLQSVRARSKAAVA
jgi:uncharacterized protein YbjT (DUF2867 family)